MTFNLKELIIVKKNNIKIKSTSTSNPKVKALTKSSAF